MSHLLLIRSLIVQFQEPAKVTAPSKKLPPTGAKNGTPAISKNESSDSSDSDSSSDEDIVSNLDARCFLCYVKATRDFRLVILNVTFASLVETCCFNKETSCNCAQEET